VADLLSLLLFLGMKTEKRSVPKNAS